MQHLLKKYNDYNDLLQETYNFIENKWSILIESLNINYISAHIGCITYEVTSTPTRMDLEFYLITSTDLTDDVIKCVEKEACCRLNNNNVEMMADGTASRYFYNFKPLKIISGVVEDSWLKD